MPRVPRIGICRELCYSLPPRPQDAERGVQNPPVVTRYILLACRIRIAKNYVLIRSRNVAGPSGFEVCGCASMYIEANIRFLLQGLAGRNNMPEGVTVLVATKMRPSRHKVSSWMLRETSLKAQTIFAP
jgi:hypothetical protein